MLTIITDAAEQVKQIIRNSSKVPAAVSIDATDDVEVTIQEQLIHRLGIKRKPSLIPFQLRKLGKNANISRQIRHIHQADTWDCGLACVQMVMYWLDHKSKATKSPDNQEKHRKWMMDFVKKKSLWTIDLVILLQHMLQEASSSSTYVFCSSNFGVDESYNKLHYYRDAFSADEVRVKKLFNKAEKQNLPLMQVHHMSLNVLISLVSREDVVAIVLVDNNIFTQQDKNQTENLSYSGHYVVLIGISTGKNDVQISKMNSQTEDDTELYNYCLVVKNPGVYKEIQFVSPTLFEKSWRAKGTDEDVILIAKHH
jgi:hypothetical protein